MFWTRVFFGVLIDFCFVAFVIVILLRACSGATLGG